MRTNVITDEMAAEIMLRPWRVGRSLGRTLYACANNDGVPADDDIWFGSADHAAVAQHICELHNDYLWRARQGATTIVAGPGEITHARLRALRERGMGPVE